MHGGIYRCTGIYFFKSAKFQFFEKKFFRRIFQVRGNPHKALFYKEKQRLKSIGIASYNQEEKSPESSQKSKK